MTYDAAIKEVVLVGGVTVGVVDGIWTWNGITWTKQNPPQSPKIPVEPTIAYDAATQSVVALYLYGPISRLHKVHCVTWTWNGITWTKQHPAQRPDGPTFPNGFRMVYDATTKDIVFVEQEPAVAGRGPGYLATWTWNGITWTKQHPAQSPPSRFWESMAYDAASRQVVLFGGGGHTSNSSGVFDGTWTWNGITWTKQHPAQSPPGRVWGSMAYDSALQQVVLFGGLTRPNRSGQLLNDTWTWNGTTWTKLGLAQSPSPRWLASMVYDAATNNLVLFGGIADGRTTSHTWTLRLARNSPANYPR